MSAFQIGVECTSQVSSWSFRPPTPPTPQTARRPNDSSPVSTGRLNKKSASFFSATFLVPFFLSFFIAVFYSRLLSFFQTGNGSTRIRPTVEERRNESICRLGNPPLYQWEKRWLKCALHGYLAEVHFPMAIWLRSSRREVDGVSFT